MISSEEPDPSAIGVSPTIADAVIIAQSAPNRRPRYGEDVLADEREYPAEVLAFVDGDTLHVQKDHGTDEFGNLTLRLLGVNCPELHREGGLEAAEFTRIWCMDNGWVTLHKDLWGAPYKKLHVRITTIKDRREKYGRYLARVTNREGTACLNDDLLSSHHAVEYNP